MQQPSQAPPVAPVEPLTDVLHGVRVTDPYRWLEEQSSAKTRKWIDEQTLYARAYFASLSGRERIKERIRELLSVETHWMPQKIGSRYFFRKREAEQEQPCIYMRTIGDTEDVLLVDPSTLGSDPYTSVSISQISADGRFLLYEIKHGGERSGRFEILEIDRRHTLPDSLPRGFLRGFMFSPDGMGFYYVHEISGAKRPYYRAAYYHTFGTQLDADEDIFFAGEAPSVRLCLKGDSKQLCFIKSNIGETTPPEFYFYDLSSKGPARPGLKDGAHILGLTFWEGRIFAITNAGATNGCIIEIPTPEAELSRWIRLVPEFPQKLKAVSICEGYILAKYANKTEIWIRIFDMAGNNLHEIAFPEDGTTVVQLQGSTANEILYKRESFTNPPAILRYIPQTKKHQLFAQTSCPLDTTEFVSNRISYPSKDGTLIPMYLVGKKNLSPAIAQPTILTGYGGFGTSMTPKFGVLTSFMIENGCLFALSCLRGGSEFGEEWHLAARARNRQKAFEDFVAAAEWLVASGYTTPGELAIFGGSNSGLLMGAALTQRPDLFKAVVCIAPILDMLRYQLFDSARKWRNEYGTAEDPDDFAALYAYSPYHRVQDSTAYPAVLLVSGDMDMCCNPMHARKMTARLQAASTSGRPVILDYNPARGHRPVMPLSERVRGLTDRLAFLCDQLGVSLDLKKEQATMGAKP
jgi:prolyl oligopeptidase